MAADGEQPGAGGNVDAGAATGADAASAAALLNEKPWYGDLPETNDDEKALKQWVEKKNWKDPLSALKSTRELEKHVGANRVMLPGEKDDITQWEGWDKLGVPKEAKAYDIARPQLPDGMTWDENFEGQVKEAAAKARIHPAQLKALVDVYTQSQIGQFTEMQKHSAAEATALQGLLKEWGADKDTNVELAKRGAKFVGLSKEEIDGLEKGLLGGPIVMKALLKFGKLAREGATVDGESSVLVGKEALKAELNRLNERIGKGETLTPEEMKKRSGLYSQIAAQGGF